MKIKTEVKIKRYKQIMDLFVRFICSDKWLQKVFYTDCGMAYYLFVLLYTIWHTIEVVAVAVANMLVTSQYL